MLISSNIFAITPPALGTSTISCPANATDPGAPADITDSCPNNISAVFVDTTYNPNPITCEGTVVWRYRYTDGCDNLTTADWTHTYTIDYSGGLTAPALGTSTVSCPANATDPGAPADITDACSRTVSAVLVGSVDAPNPVTCEGTRTWTYRYTACDNLTTADWTHTYTIDYSGGLTAPALGTSTVSCPANATDPGAPADITDACSRTVSAVLVGSVDAPNPVTCEGTRTWTYRYTACDNLTTADWTHTYTIDYSGGLTAPALGTSTVSCPANATDPGAPADITDACSRTVSAVLVGSVDAPNPVTCEGTRTWTYRYTACDNLTTADWTHTYTIDYSGGLTAPALGTSTVSCPANATDPGAPADITDACSRTVSAVLVGSVDAPNPVTCEGTRTWTYRYTACDNLTTADWTHTYTIDYSGGLTAPALGTSTVSCPANATDPGAPADITDACSRTVSAVLVGSVDAPNPVTCEGTRTWTYRYTACDNLTTADWTHTYTIDYSGGLTAPALGTSTVSCPANATDPGAPADITDACSRTVSAVLVGSVDAPNPVTCEGTRTWTYRYTACDNLTTADWTHTYTIDYSGGLTAPALGTSTVSCPANATDPGAPADITDACSRTVSAVLVGSVDAPNPVTCEGTRTWTYRYTACDNLTTADWTHTYTIDYSGGLTAPALGTSTVSCPANATDPGAPADITDACSRTVSAVLVGSVDAPNPVTCEGTRTWTYRYTACDNLTTADWTHTYTIDYSGGLTAPALGTSTVSCPANATDPGAPADITDACSRTVSAVLVGSVDAPNPVTCEGTRTWTYRYTACDLSTTVDWTHTYTITLTSPIVPSNGASTVECIGDATQVAAPVVTDSCGNNLTAVITENADPGCGGDKIYTYTYTDCANNISVYTYTYTVIDTIPPTASTLAPVNVQCLVDVPAQNILDVLGETDNCSIPVVTFVSDVSNGNSDPEIITRTYKVTDACGNFINVIQSITVDDIIAPIITCPPTAASYNTDAAQCDATLSFTATAIDNCNGSPAISYNISGTPITFPHDFPVGLTTVTAVANDGDGQIDSCNFNVVVVDNQLPSLLSCPLDITVDNDIDTCGADVFYNAPTATDNCGIPSVVQTDATGFTAGSTFPVGTTTLEYTATDVHGNISICSFDVTVEDNQEPYAIFLPTLTDECSVTVSEPQTTDNCKVTIIGANGDYSWPHTFNKDGTYVINWLFDDGNGNTITVDQTVIIDDVTFPVPDINPNSSLPPINVVDCEVDVTAPSATDNCEGSITGKTTTSFPITTFGTTVVTWTYDDKNGQETTQTQNVTLTKPAISGGVLLGHVDDLDLIEFPPSNSVAISACPDDINPVTINLSGQIGIIVRWEKFEADSNGWNIIPNTAGDVTYSIDFDFANTKSTVFRVLIQVGTCIEYSTLVNVHAIPPDVPPTLEDYRFDECFGTEITLVATSGYTGIVDPEDEDAGQFDQGQFPDKWNPLMWKIDGEVAGVSFTGAANNTKFNNWSATNNHPVGTLYTIEYDSKDFKFAVAHGDYTSKDYIDAFPPGNPTTLETPIMSLIGLQSPSFSFNQAWNLVLPGDIGLLELSLDGGETYNITLQDISVIAPTGKWDWASDPGSTVDNYVFDTFNTSFDLSAYNMYDQIRIRWTFYGTTDESAWAIDNITLPLGGSPGNEIEWTDGIGDPNEDPLASGTLSAAFTFTPKAPGFHEYGATSLVNGCRAYDPDGTAIAEVLINYAYAGKDVVYAQGECGENVVTLNAYDNMLSAIDNDLNGAFNDVTSHASLLDPGCTNCNDFGTMTPGKWTIVNSTVDCTVDGFSFSDDTDPRATFTGDPGTYTLRWTVGPFGPDNLLTCSDDVTIQITNCAIVDFDGENDNVTFRDNYNLNSSFSIECWIKPDATTNTGGANNAIQTIISKRDANNFGNKGYDLRLVNNTISFNFNNSGSISSPYPIDTSRWYHIAVTREAGGSSRIYRLYIDGIEVNSISASGPSDNNNDFILGAMDQTGNPPNKPVNYFSGRIDEVRIWNKTLNVDHIRQMMNQQIDNSGGNVIGDVIPMIVRGPDANKDGNDDDPLTWANLDGYYRMNQIDCGYLEAFKGGIDGKLRNISSQQDETAPLPYTTKANGNWNDTTVATPWTYGDTVWDYPNALGVDGTRIDWNIVVTNDNITSDTQDVTVLGLLSETPLAELTITDQGADQDETSAGTGLWITHYLKLDGIIDLIGESQLVQKRYTPTQFSESILEVASGGYLERDQQGTTNKHNYNYWSSPVSEINTTANNTLYKIDYDIGGVLRGGYDSSNPTPIDWETGHDASGAMNPIGTTNRWIYAYENYPQNTYAAWSFKAETGTIATGLAFTMKGSGYGDPVNDVQNYVFTGKPNNATLTNPITNWFNALVGNPYPSAIDANEFIKDNIPGGNSGTSASIEGPLYFWIHYDSNNTHVLRDYEGGYAVYSLGGAIGPVTPPITVDGLIISGIGSSTLIPRRYIPVGQGFFVNAETTGGGPVTFKNSQRVFRREAPANSQFLRSANNSSPPVNNEEADLIKRVRLDFESSEGATRPLLLAFVPDNKATDGFDYGYDAKFFDWNNSPSYMAWTIKDNYNLFVIQGVGDFDNAKQYPVTVNLATSGKILISLAAMENFDHQENVYVYDSLLDIYSEINNSSFEMVLDAGEYLNRFYITFKGAEEEEIITVEDELENTIVNYLNNSNEIYVHVPNDINVKQVYLINILGQTINSWNTTNTPNIASKEFKIPVKNLSEGNYIIKVETETNTINKKVIVTQ